MLYFIFNEQIIFFSFFLNNCVFRYTSTNSWRSLKGTPFFKEWIATERLITKESSSWEIEKSSLNDLVELLEEEKQAIDEGLQSVEKENSAGEEERIKLADQNEDLKSAILPVSEALERLEHQLLRLAPRFPPPLQHDLQSFLNRIPKKIKKKQ